MKDSLPSCGHPWKQHTQELPGTSSLASDAQSPRGHLATHALVWGFSQKPNNPTVKTMQMTTEAIIQTAPTKPGLHSSWNVLLRRQLLYTQMFSNYRVPFWTRLFLQKPSLPTTHCQSPPEASFPILFPLEAQRIFFESSLFLADLHLQAPIPLQPSAAVPNSAWSPASSDSLSPAPASHTPTPAQPPRPGFCAHLSHSSGPRTSALHLMGLLTQPQYLLSDTLDL